MEITIETCSAIPDRDEMDPMLEEYFNLIATRLESAGGEPFDTSLVINEFWDEAHHYLSPFGATFLARDQEGALIGMGSLRDIGGGTGELKRLYVKSAARGTGLGRRLVEARITTARQMGLRTLLADTLQANVEMLGLYASLGFERVSVMEQSATYRLYPELRPYLAFIRKEL